MMDESEFPNSDDEFDFEPAESSASKLLNPTKPSTVNVTQLPTQPRFLSQNDDDEFPDEDELDFIANEISKPRPPTSTVTESSQTRTLKQSSANEFPDDNDEILPSQSLPSTQSGTQRKRTFEELRRDVAELLETGPNPSNADLVHPDFLIDFDALERAEKRPRWDQPKAVIEAFRKKALEKRMKIEEHSMPNVSNFPISQTKRETMSLKIPPWSFVAVTRPEDSQRIYVRVRPKNTTQLPKITPSSGLLNVNYQKLKEEAERILVEKALREDVPVEVPAAPGIVDDELWVDKYRPKSYMELLSDETVNRAFLHWIKLWDKIVFNKEVKKPKKSLNKDGDSMKFGQKEETEMVDKKGVPVHKIVLLSGPPGLGKTTLAHLVARHAGYNVVEINASDERGPEAFRQALMSSTQMKSLIGADPRPNCLVFDEVDGAPAASIDLLIKFVQGKLTGKKKKAGDGIAKENDHCKRPVICICNEAYSPALRTLRQMAYIINVPKVSPSNLADRLSTIARRERLNVDQGTLMRLAERSGCDIRSCLGALQYMGSDCNKTNISLGSKDMKKSIFEGWRDILQIPVDRAGPLSQRERSQRILHVAYSENTERLAQGIFENYPSNCHEKMPLVASSLEWFQIFDRISTIVNTKQDWTVASYMNYCFVSWHFGFAGTLRPKISFPFSAGDAHQKLSKTMAILAISRKSRGQDTETIVLDVAPFLFELLNPKLRSVASNLYSTKEKQDLERLIDVMLDLGMSFVQEKSEDGAVDYTVEPNLFDIGIFPECKVRRGLSYAVKQIVAQELELERLRRAAIATGVSTSRNNSKDNEKSESSNVKEKEKTEEFIPSTNAFRPTHLNDLERIVTPKDNRYRNFFENFKKPQTEEEKTSPKAEKPGKKYRNLIAKYGVWFKYKEGFSNSIRRNVSLEDIL